MKKGIIGVRIFTIFLVCCFHIGCIRSCMFSRGDKDRPIIVDLSLPIETLDPRHATSATASRVAKLIYAPLFSLESNARPKPLLAETIEALDEKTFKITLRKGLTFHDESALTAHDVVYTFSHLGSDDVASPYAEKFKYLEAVKAIDDRSVVFELNKPHAPFLTDLCAMGIVSKRACLNRSKECRHENLGSGPFMVKQINMAKESWHLEPFLGWYDGAPKSEVIFRVVRDENTRMLELIGKKADLVDSEISPKNALELKKYSHLKLFQMPGLGFTYLAINVRDVGENLKKGSNRFLTKTALADARVRKAIAHAIDFDKIIEKFLLGTAKRVSGLIPNGHWAKDENLKPLAYNPQITERLLDEAGFKRQGENNVRFSLTILTTPSRLRQSIVQLYAEYLRKVGIDANIRVKDWGALYADMKQGNFDMFSAIWVPVTEPDLYYFVHHSNSIPKDGLGGGNRHGYKNPEVDHLIELGRSTMEPEKRKYIYQRIERMLLDDLPYIPLWNENRLVIINQDRIGGFEPSPTGSFLGLVKAYVKKT